MCATNSREQPDAQPTNRRIGDKCYKLGIDNTRKIKFNRNKTKHQFIPSAKGVCPHSVKVHPMDALTATKPAVFVLEIKTIPALFHLTNRMGDG